MSHQDELTLEEYIRREEEKHQQALLRKWKRKARERNGHRLSFRKEMQKFLELRGQKRTA
jgi:hypothetical protein